MQLPYRPQGCIFDLDGVITDTARFHFLAWQRLAQSLGIAFTEHDNEQLKGVSRKESLERILAMGNKQLSPAEFEQAMARKNAWYVEYIATMTPADILPGVVEFLQQLRSQGIKIALGSASKNAPMILDRLGLTTMFDAVIDGNHTSRSKPDPEVFLLGAQALGIAPATCLVFEDALAGVEAAINGGFTAIGVGDPQVLTQADAVIAGFEGLKFA